MTIQEEIRAIIQGHADRGVGAEHLGLLGAMVALKEISNSTRVGGDEPPLDYINKRLV